MNRRTFIGTSAVAGVGIAGMGFKCGGPSVSSTVTILTGAVDALRILFPNHTALGKIVTLANSFNEAWVAGKFDSAKTFFTNLDSLVGDVINDLGINASTRVKLILATLGIGVRTIAALIQEQGNAQPAVARTATASDPAAVDRVKVLANAEAADAILKNSRPK